MTTTSYYLNDLAVRSFPDSEDMEQAMRTIYIGYWENRDIAQTLRIVG